MNRGYDFQHQIKVGPAEPVRRPPAKLFPSLSYRSRRKVVLSAVSILFAGSVTFLAVQYSASERQKAFFRAVPSVERYSNGDRVTDRSGRAIGVIRGVQSESVQIQYPDGRVKWVNRTAVDEFMRVKK